MSSHVCFEKRGRARMKDRNLSLEPHQHFEKDGVHLIQRGKKTKRVLAFSGGIPEEIIAF